MSEPDIVKELDDISALFVQTAHAVEHIDERIYLRTVTPSTLYFSDRPQRVVGHLSTTEFVECWGVGENSFDDDPPNAVLAFIGEGALVPADVVIEISDPILCGSDLSYAAQILEGTVHGRIDGCSLFIDPFGLPLSPVSVAGMHRRDRRRSRRR